MHTHCILTMLSVKTANIIIRDSFYIHGKKVYPSKLKKEPLWCLKCHGWGHKASQCSAEVDTCGTCGNTHQTTVCKEEINKWCVSCQSPTHTSWDCQCPAFLSCCDISPPQSHGLITPPPLPCRRKSTTQCNGL